LSAGRVQKSFRIIEKGGYMKIVVEKNKRGKWYWKLVARNDRILAHSEDYSSKGACYDTIHTIGKAEVIEK
jgi:uncharacterized protein YegP (UPF0339 family)